MLDTIARLYSWTALGVAWVGLSYLAGIPPWG